MDTGVKTLENGAEKARKKIESIICTFVLKKDISLCGPEYIILVLTFQGCLGIFLTMKIEKISENQIKFTLNRTDLASRQIKISELAYGTEKTRDLIEDMIEQASDELDFELNDDPLMIEAIPVSMDCIVLMVTKIDEPETVDTKFSGFSNLKDLLAEDEPDEKPAADEKSSAGMTRQQATERVHELFNERRGKNPGAAAQRMFSFKELGSVIEFAHQTGSLFNGESSLYSSAEDGRYYLILKDSAGDIRTFGRICNTALEYASKEPFGYARDAYIDEHFKCMIKENALQRLYMI